MSEQTQRELDLYTNKRLWQGVGILVLNTLALALLYGGYRLAQWVLS